MIATALRNEADAYASTPGSVPPFLTEKGMATMPDPVILPGSVPADDHGFFRSIENSPASPAKESALGCTLVEQGIKKLQRFKLKSERLGDPTDISYRRSKLWPLSAKDAQTLREALTIIHYLNQNNQDNALSLFPITGRATGVHMSEPSRHSGDATDQNHVEGEQTPEPHRIPLSPAAWDMRRPQPQALLLEAEQERPPLIPGKVRIVHLRRAPKRTG